MVLLLSLDTFFIQKVKKNWDNKMNVWAVVADYLV